MGIGWNNEMLIIYVEHTVLVTDYTDLIEAQKAALEGALALYEQLPHTAALGAAGNPVFTRDGSRLNCLILLTHVKHF